MSISATRNSIDLALAGGGLAGGLIALALHKLRPELNVALIEAGDNFGGNHIWSFFDTDIAAEDRWLLEPLIAEHWDGYDVRFPKYERSFTTGYNTIKSEDFDQYIRNKLSDKALLTNSNIDKIGNGTISFDNSDDLEAETILDVRGGGDYSALDYGYQKFMGQVLRLNKPHGLTKPVIMDATVDQIDGYRFVYSLPFSTTEVFVEDTYYSDSSALDEAAYGQRIIEYAAQMGWDVAEVLRSETGCLPVLYGGNFDSFWDAGGDIARAGARAALIHPVTSYSLPMAVRTAMMIAKMPEINQANLNSELKKLSINHWDETKFYRLLCAMMFKSAQPDQRYRTLEHTYTKSQELIERFYAGNSSFFDKAALLTGRPPVPISKAIPVLMQYR